MLKSLKSVFEIKSLRKKIIATLLLVVVYRFLSVIPIPGVNTDGLQAIMEQQGGLAFFSALMGGGLERFSIILMGLSPYINAMIILQLLGVIVPKIGDMQKEGEAGQRKITRMTRWLTLPLAFVQSYGMIVLLNTLAGGSIIDSSNVSVMLMAMLIATTGTIFLMWIGEVMTEYGIGNGISVIITAGVLAGVPSVIMTHINNNDYSLLALLFFATLIIIYIIIKFTEGNRRIPIIYTRTGREEKSYFPIRINQAGMIPIIFAVSLVTFPTILGQILYSNISSQKAVETLTIGENIGKFLTEHFSMSNPTWSLIIIYFLLVLAFSFFYVSITFNTENVSESIQKRGGYIPGIRPGSETSNYLSKVSAHLNLFGGSFLALIAVLPYIMGKIMGKSIDFIISGAGLIIIVSVVLDIIRKVDSDRKMFDYSKFK
ncbi:preprotein translocase subunit SecY [Candidatus Gracilibacteria bacterium]|nr:MAG: preprotein translocase subunit SecY [Candidatus Gracilibacteria bacterium]PIE85748.1 MAG: preprotein translocase subunit SecY [Candidatus Gracilibacteria bacterium]